MSKAWFLLGLALLAACSKEGEPAVTPPPIALHHFEPASVTRGAALYQQHCAICHGPQAQGHPDWQTPSDGSFAAAPPLDGTGNDWKRSRAELAATIRQGVRRKSDKIEVMPAWKGRLERGDIEDVINWMQSLWPAPVYDTWNKAQTAAAPGS